MDRLGQRFEQFLKERTYLKNVTSKTRVAFRDRIISGRNRR